MLHLRTLAVVLVTAKLLAGCGNLVSREDDTTVSDADHDKGSAESHPHTSYNRDFTGFTDKNWPAFPRRIPPSKSHTEILPPSFDDEEADESEITETTTKAVEVLPPDNRQNGLWGRILAGRRLKATHDDIETAIERYQAMPTFFTDLSVRAKPWLYYVVQAVEQHDMPLEIALLPAIESLYDPLALSPRQAAGIWQIMPDTGKALGLKQNIWYDERRDIIASTDAALDYLSYLHRQFKQDWLLALAAYNYGEGNIRNAISKNQKAGRRTDYWSLDLPPETRQFVPKLIALSRIITNPQYYGINTLPNIDNQPQVQRIDVGRPISLSIAAQITGLSISDVKHLNPGHKQDITDPNGPYHLILPTDRVQPFRRQLAHMSSMKLLAGKTAPPAVGMHRYQVHNGDSLWEIAQKYHTSPARLKKINGLQSNRLHSGMMLQIPAAAHETSTTNDTGKKLPVPKETTRPTSTKNSKHQVIHTVSTGDTLWDIARLHRVSVKQLVQWNRLGHRPVLQIGQPLKVWVDE